MPKRPRIAVPIPTGIDLAYNRQCLPAYLAAIEQSGGEPVTIPLDGSAHSIVRGCDGILLPGSLADVDPARYSQPRDSATAPADPAREAADLALLEHAERSHTPVLGICYGLQSINVWRGGSLHQDLHVLPVNHAAGTSVATAHTASIFRGSLLAQLCGPAEAPEQRLPVNSSHHQAIAALGEGLNAAANCPQDNVLEAIEAAGDHNSWLVAVQWHPERSYTHSPTSRALFRRFVQEAGA